MKESKETIESEHPSFFMGLMNNNPIFYKKDIKSTAFIEKIRKKLLDFNKDTDEKLPFNTLWIEFCKSEAIKRLNTIGRDIADKKERDSYKKELEHYIQLEGTTNSIYQL